jgi:hypothetical protein
MCNQFWKSLEEVAPHSLIWDWGSIWKTGALVSMIEMVVVCETQIGGVHKLQAVKVTGALLQFPLPMLLKLLVKVIPVQGSEATAPPLLFNQSVIVWALLVSVHTTDKGDGSVEKTGPVEGRTVKIAEAFATFPQRSVTEKITVVCELHPEGGDPTKLSDQVKRFEEAQLSVA